MSPDSVVRAAETALLMLDSLPRVRRAITAAHKPHSTAQRGAGPAYASLGVFESQAAKHTPRAANAALVSSIPPSLLPLLAPSLCMHVNTYNQVREELLLHVPGISTSAFATTVSVYPYVSLLVCIGVVPARASMRGLGRARARTYVSAIECATIASLFFQIEPRTL